MNRLSYKTFVWGQNPHTYQEECARTAQYETVDGVAYFRGMGDRKRIIRGEGVFHGDRAVSQFQALQALFEENTPGNLEHPVWGIRYCYFTGLELTQEPKTDYISYRFEFTGALANGVVPK